MKFIETPLPGVFLIEMEKLLDERGFFTRTFCEREFEALGLQGQFKQCSLSYNQKKGTLRGLHYQVAPYEEVKMVGCLSGALYDVVVDLRPTSPTYKKWVGFELNGRDVKQLYIPVGCAHGFQTLEDETKIWYQISEFYHPEASRGIHWSDPQFGIAWPEGERIISAKDQLNPLFQETLLMNALGQ